MLTENQKREAKLDAFVRKTLGIVPRSESQIGMVPSGRMKFENGLDEIDKEAARQGYAAAMLRKNTPDREHIKM